MIRNLAALAFYLRFFRSFSRLGFERRVPASQRGGFRFSGQRWLVTGASGGIGRAIALGAASAGAQVVAIARDPKKLDALVADAGPSRGLVTPMSCDLASVIAVRGLAKGIADLGLVDVVVANVGVMLHDWKLTDEGIETGVATNLLNHYVLVDGLARNAALHGSSIIVSMSSGGLYGARLDVDALEAATADRHDGFMAYAQHKRAQVELTRYWNQKRPGGASAYVMHPGWVDTEGVRTSLPGFRRRLASYLRTPTEGADTAFWLAATRPPVPQAGVWLDRHCDTEHAYGFTRGGASADELVAWIERRIPATEKR
jgi:NAD(P)-dependent dehydrogenase (short-subunit alcohol dehydrogenase family)